jgi:hypothetical protein
MPQTAPAKRLRATKQFFCSLTESADPVHGCVLKQFGWGDTKCNIHSLARTPRPHVRIPGIQESGSLLIVAKCNFPFGSIYG